MRRALPMFRDNTLILFGWRDPVSGVRIAFGLIGRAGFACGSLAVLRQHLFQIVQCVRLV